MIAKIFSAALSGLSVCPVTVEVDVASGGLPSFTVVGLPDKSVEESRERVRSAIKNSNLNFPIRRITVNLAPSDIPKEGSLFDLPIALGILTASGQIPCFSDEFMAAGELSLNGDLRRTHGMLPLGIFAKNFKKTLIVPNDCVDELSIISGLSLLPFEKLTDLISHFTDIKKQDLIVISGGVVKENKEAFLFDMKDIYGQEKAKRALMIAAAGGHNVLFYGPPGSGKTLLARSLPSILPPLTVEEVIEVSTIYSVGGLLNKEMPYVFQRPFRSPHHSTSHVGLVGGGSKIKPGEVSLAHRGVLFLDEVAEFSSQAIESLRQPLEDGHIVVSRASGSVKFPARFMLVAAQNPCPCGYLGDKFKQCGCSFNEIRSYQRKISGPIKDRIDLIVEVPAVEVTKITKGSKEGESSEIIREKVIKTRKKQQERFLKKNFITNSEMGNKDVKYFCELDAEGQNLLDQAIERFGLSARGVFRTLKVARTIADLEEMENVLFSHIAEALQYRGN